MDIVDLAMYSIFSDFKETPIKKESEKSDADRFKEITDKMSDTYKRKNHDYGNAFPKCMMSLVSTTATERYERK